MAEIFRHYFYVDPATGKRVNANTPGAVRKKSKNWHIRYYTSDGTRHKVTGYADKKATEAKAAKLERRAIRLDEGIVEPSDIHAKTPLSEHAEDFRRYLAAKGNTEEYVAKTHSRLQVVLDGCRFTNLADVQSSAVVEFLGTLRGQGKSVKTANDYLAAVKGFTRWLWRDKRCLLDALAGLSQLANGETDVRHGRRDFSFDELARLLEAAGKSIKDFLGLTGTDRHFLYLTACATGFRVSELASMTPESFNLDGDTPTAMVEASCTKNRKEACQPLPLDVAKALGDYLAGKAAGAIVWPGNWTLRGAKMIRRDLEEARETWLKSFQDARQRKEAEQSDFLVYQDAEGRYADFHALRHSFITMVGKAGVSPREHQDLARHSTYALTSRYSHSRFYDLAAAVQSLPIPKATGPNAAQATGTDGRQISRGPNRGLKAVNSGHCESQAGKIDTALSVSKSPVKSGISSVFRGIKGEMRRSGIGESNPFHSLGKAGHGRYTNPARTVVNSWRRG